MDTYSLNVRELEMNSNKNQVLNTNEVKVVFIEDLVTEKTAPLSEGHFASSSCLKAPKQPDLAADPLYNILCSWRLEQLYRNFLELGLDFECLKYLDKEDLLKITGDARSSYGLFVKLKGNLRNWRRSQGIEEPSSPKTSNQHKGDKDIVTNLRIQSWLSDLRSPSSSSSGDTQHNLGHDIAIANKKKISDSI